jgi:hypothetical protein
VALFATGFPSGSGRLVFKPFFLSSPARGSSSNTPKHRVGGAELENFTTTPQASRVYTLLREVHAAQHNLKARLGPVSKKPKY